MYGWNFTGGKDGRNVFHDQKEETRLYARLRPHYDGKTLAQVPSSRQAEFRLYEQAKAAYITKRAEAEAAYQRDAQQLAEDIANSAALKKAYGVQVLDSALLRHPPTTDTTLAKLASLLYRVTRRMQQPNADSALNYYRRYNAQLKDRLDYAYNLAYDPRPIIGDHVQHLRQRDYSNANLATSLADHGTKHGTHCAGIIAADRTNKVGGKGVADHVRILSVRCIPDGDERDKDVANTIRYAVVNGAKAISMSFRKYFSPEKTAVDDAMRYANARGVLLVHAAGNDHLDTDQTFQYPQGRYLNGQQIPNLLTVGASARTNDAHLVAPFSNYGRQSVDMFAPGVEIMSTVPNGGYAPLSGTSMAAPAVAGVAAVLKTYFPQLSPTDLKRIIMQSAAPCHTQVLKPGTEEMVDFATLSRTGGIVNLYEAVKLASATQAPKAQARK